MNTNSDNPKVGKQFQMEVKRWLEEDKLLSFVLEKRIAIGNPAKLHGFDIVDTDCRIVVECKCYTWTETGNVPSAKMGFVNEAAFYLSLLPDTVDKAIVMLRATHQRRKETLAEYYFRTNRHLLGKTKIMEFDMNTKKMILVGPTSSEVYYPKIDDSGIPR